MATFIRRTSATKPVETCLPWFSPELRTQLMITTSASCPWKPSTVPTLTALGLGRASHLPSSRLTSWTWSRYGVTTATEGLSTEVGGIYYDNQRPWELGAWWFRFSTLGQLFAWPLDEINSHLARGTFRLFSAEELIHLLEALFENDEKLQRTITAVRQAEDSEG